MARKGNTLKKSALRKDEFNEDQPKSGKKSGKKPVLPSWLTDGRAVKITGVFFILLALYLLFAFSSYLFLYFNWGSDDLFTTYSFRRVLFDTTIEAGNWAGRLGAALSLLLIKKGFGIAAYLIILMLLVAGVRMAVGAAILPAGKTFRNSLLGLLWLPVALGFLLQQSAYAILGGITGYQSARWLEGLLGKPGTAIFLLFSLVAILVFAFNMPLELPKRPAGKDEAEESEEADDNLQVNQKTGQNRFNTAVLPEDKYNTVEFAVKDEDSHPETKNAPFASVPEENGFEPVEPRPAEPKATPEIELTIENIDTLTENQEIRETPDRFTIDTEFDPTLELPHYQFPTLELLDDYGSTASISVQKEELEANKNRIVETLANYSIQIDKIKATIGPTVTLYEIIPAPGVRISKIKNLEDDIALSLAAMGIRIIAPIPGKGTIGIEVPNLKPEIVSMKSIMGNERFQNSKFELPFGMGKTIQNEPYIADLTRMPHILMAGATGQGKSVGLNAIIASILYKKHPSQVKFVMIDPKKVELTLFSKIERHFLAKLPDSEEAIITDTRKVVRTLNSLNIEMDNRYDLLKDAQVRNIKEYNVKFVDRRLNPLHGHRFLPYIIVVIDEFADLIMTAGKEIETPLTRLAQLARAIGIHLVIATQRPSVNIITGTIKANFPARIAFRVISKIDSRTILDTGGADQLVGRGDMLLSTGSDLIRLQCAFVDTPEVERITEFIGSQRAYPDAYHLPEYADEQDEKEVEFDPAQRDELFEDAARIIVQTQQGSTSLLQRKLKLGYNRAGRIIDQLEAAGIVGPFEGSKAREVKVANEMALEQYLKDLRPEANPNDY
ncbi:DNA segregation ATPase FtsK/SpoIIIE [Lentimicrobium saccharophilum]|uniref:DNA segregation ATPase FtsK/SpoIIIE n=1 Tax=Lentimicrobium saccharophilum TaxID=1678841 RepID=A0A0S7C1S8_9BACT|nr:DNA translocase FtsK [Lentimicrobium saccharophilum]GAP42739.1 DNA segregation ATPase FtsK/SpoIIIE [Lentimicrobium saccharophilum]